MSERQLPPPSSSSAPVVATLDTATPPSEATTTAGSATLTITASPQPAGPLVIETRPSRVEITRAGRRAPATDGQPTGSLSGTRWPGPRGVTTATAVYGGWLHWSKRARWGRSGGLVRSRRWRRSELQRRTRYDRAKITHGPSRALVLNEHGLHCSPYQAISALYETGLQTSARRADLRLWCAASGVMPQRCRPFKRALELSDEARCVIIAA